MCHNTIVLLSLVIGLNNNSDTSKVKIVSDQFIFENPPFEQCHASSIESTPEGLIAAWFGGTKEGNEDVEIWVSRNEKGIWSKPVSVANGIQHADKRYPCWNPVLFYHPIGTLMLFYKVGPNPANWWGELKTSEDFGKTWSTARRLPEDILGPIKNKPVLLADDRLICPASTEVGPNEGWKIHFEVTSDLGYTWEIIGPINDGDKINAIQPSILTYDENKLQILARSLNSGVVSSWSYDGGYKWEPISSTNLPNPNSGTDAVTLKNGYQLLVYNRSTKSDDKWSGQRSPLNVAISKDGISWDDILVLEDDKGEFSYPAVIQSEDGHVHITYTWKRRNIRYVALEISD